MKMRFSNQRNVGLTRTDVIVLIGIAALFMFLIMSVTATSAAKRRAQRINCVSNLKQVALAARVWEGDNTNLYPQQVSVTNGGAMELLAASNVAGAFQVMSNQLETPRILVCPADDAHSPATNFTSDFNSSHISYFLSPDASETYPQMIFAGDDNLMVNGVPVKPGILQIKSSDMISFDATRHIHVGNVAFADGSVSEVSSSGFQNALQCATNGTPFAANRLAIP